MVCHPDGQLSRDEDCVTATAYPLAWPDGWPRTPSHQRKRASFGTTERKSYSHIDGHYLSKSRLSISDGIKRIRETLDRMGVDVANDMIVSTNLKLNMSGIPRGNQGEPADHGVAVYWQQPKKPMRVMAIDTYDRVADNLGAIAATLEAMRAIERHGGAVILDRAFTGFTALPAPKNHWAILGLAPNASRDEIVRAWRVLIEQHHPDRGGSTERMAEINAARDAALRGAPQ
jgi:hypothetical protein